MQSFFRSLLNDDSVIRLSKLLIAFSLVCFQISFQFNLYANALGDRFSKTTDKKKNYCQYYLMSITDFISIRLKIP